MRGATRLLNRIRPTNSVSIHAPHAGRDFNDSWISPLLQVSIHAPHAGRDDLYSFAALSILSFNPRAPCGARPKQFLLPKQNQKFQSTRPMRGATIQQWIRLLEVRVSIHAPHAGRDRGDCPQAAPMSCFNPRAPCGARLFRHHLPVLRHVFQSTRPMRGATQHHQVHLPSREVSIHAPHAGRDVTITKGY